MSETVTSGQEMNDLNGGEPSTTQGYRSNAHYLNECFAFIGLLKAQRIDSTRVWLAHREIFSAMYADIRREARAALRQKVDLPLEKLIRKHKLDDVEAQLLWILAYAAVHGEYELNALETLRKLISRANRLDPLAAVKYWRKDAKLIQKRIILPSSRGMAVDDIDRLHLDPTVLDRLLGRKAPRRRPVLGRCSPATLYQKLGEYVVSQDSAKRTIATGVYGHLQTCRLNRKRKGVDRLRKSNILMIGPTGTGKTHLCRTLAQVLQVPLVICDATQYTETGYVGSSVEEMLMALYEKAGKDQRRMEHGIIFIDEIDKIAQKNVGSSHYSNKDVSGLCVQQELLKLLDGEIVPFRGFRFDVSNILFIVGGAFPGLEEAIHARLKDRRIGFSAGGQEPEGGSGTSLKQVTTEDIQAYGFCPEFIGRFASLVTLDPLGKEDLIGIMTKPKNSILSQYQALFGASGIDLQVPQSSLAWVAEQALRRHTGARGLRAIMETHLSPILFDQGRALSVRSPRPPLKEVVFAPDVEVSAPPPIPLEELA